jgi:ferredoxin
LVEHFYRRERGYEAIRRVAPRGGAPIRAAAAIRDALVELGYSGRASAREASRCLDCGVTPVFDGARCVLCGGCADVCPTQCLKLVRWTELAPDSELEAAISGALGPGADLEAGLGHSQGRRPLHPLRRLRHALPGGRHHHGARDVPHQWRSQ